MNLLLFEASELASGASLQLEGRRAKHLLKVLKVKPGDTLRAGVINGALGQARVLDTHTNHVSVSFQRSAEPALAPSRNVLVLGIPRPKVLSRCLRFAAALGYSQIHIVRSRRVEKSHLESHCFELDAMREELVLGLEQGQRTTLPEVQIHRRFKPYVEDQVPSLGLPPMRIVAHPGADDSSQTWLEHAFASATQKVVSNSQPCSQLSPGAAYCLAIGPEGGWIPFEVELFQSQGFRPMQFGSATLRVESALSYITGQLELLQRLARPDQP